MSVPRVRLIDSVKIAILKNLTIGTFMVLPNKVASTFVSLSILSLIYDTRDSQLTSHPFTADKFKSLLNVSYTEEVLVLPEYTVKWFWTEDTLNDIVYINGQPHTIREVITDNAIFLANIKTVISCLVGHIVPALRAKLGLQTPAIKHELEDKVTLLLMNTIVESICDPKDPTWGGC